MSDLPLGIAVGMAINNGTDNISLPDIVLIWYFIGVALSYSISTFVLYIKTKKKSNLDDLVMEVACPAALIGLTWVLSVPAMAIFFIMKWIADRWLQKK